MMSLVPIQVVERKDGNTLKEIDKSMKKMGPSVKRKVLLILAKYCLNKEKMNGSVDSI